MERNYIKCRGNTIAILLFNHEFMKNGLFKKNSKIKLEGKSENVNLYVLES